MTTEAAAPLQSRRRVWKLVSRFVGLLSHPVARMAFFAMGIVVASDAYAKGESWFAAIVVLAVAVTAGQKLQEIEKKLEDIRRRLRNVVVRTRAPSGKFPDIEWSQSFGVVDEHDRRTGFHLQHFDSGVLRMGVLREDKLEGVWVEFGANGDRLVVSPYRAGKPHGEWHLWHGEGRKYCEMTYDLGRLCGPARSWDKSGALQLSCIFQDDKIQGECKYLRVDGQVVVGIFEHSVGVGTWTVREGDGEAFEADEQLRALAANEIVHLAQSVFDMPLRNEYCSLHRS